MSEELEIFKLQRPIFGERVGLVYNQKRTINLEIPLSEKEMELMGREFKIFVYGKIHFGSLRIESKAPWQSW